MKDVDGIITAYQGLRIVGDRADTLERLIGIERHTKRDTLAVLRGGSDPQRDTMALHRDALRLLKELPPLPKGENTEYPTYNHDVAEDNDNRRLKQWIEEQRQQCVPPVSRWSSTSGGSSRYSENTVSSSSPPSLYHYGSKASSQTSEVFLSEPKSPPKQHGRRTRTPSSSQSAATIWPGDKVKPQRYYSNLAPSRPHSPVRQTNSRTGSPRRQLESRSKSPARHINSRANSPMGQIHCRTDIHSRTESPVRQPLPPRCLTPTCVSERPHTPTSTTRSPYGSRNASPEPRGRSRLDTAPMLHLLRPVPSTAQLSVTPTVKSSITTTAQEKMMNGRPCKDNNYWGFCKGAWATREDPSKGLALTSRPEGMFSTSQVWQCRHCLLETSSCSVPHPTKKNKTEAILDDRIHISTAGIRYRWSFLAKSHVKKTAYSSRGRGGAGEELECNFGCVICSVEGTVTGIYGSVDTLMDHIAQEHVYTGNMNHLSMARSKVVVGRTAGDEEEWDVNIPSQESLLF